jgi:hypothetical protein
MQAVVYHDVGDIRVEDVPEPYIQKPTGMPLPVYPPAQFMTPSRIMIGGAEGRAKCWH